MKKRIMSFVKVLFLVIVLMNLNTGFASNTPVGGGGMGGGPGLNLEDPQLTDIFTIVGNIFNILVMAAGGVLVVMIAYGAVKASMALGDPRQLQGAKDTWTHALLGFFIVVGFFAVFVIMAGFLGITSLSPANLLNGVMDAIGQLTGTIMTR